MFINLIRYFFSLLRCNSFNNSINRTNVVISRSIPFTVTAMCRRFIFSRTVLSQIVITTLNTSGCKSEVYWVMIKPLRMIVLPTVLLDSVVLHEI